jgi:DNA-binding CsgD family transcriptional regulator
MALGDLAADMAIEAGRRLTRQEFSAEMATVLDIASSYPVGEGMAVFASERHGLSPRELEVLCLLGQRLSDLEIADQLFITRRTASKHVSAILAKLDVPDRRAAATEARRLGLG